MTRERYPKSNIKGILHVDVFKNSKKISEEEHNIIVDSCVAILAQSIGGVPDYADHIISKIKVSDGNEPVDATNTDLDGDNSFEKDIDSVTYDPGTPGEVTFNFSFDETEYNGENVWQFGLFNADGVMFSMLSRNPSKTYPIEKDADVVISGWWKIQFVNS